MNDMEKDMVCVCVRLLVCLVHAGYCYQEYWTMNPQQQSAVGRLMKQLIQHGVVSPTEWPHLQDKWYQDIFNNRSSYKTNGVRTFSTVAHIISGVPSL